MTEEERDLGGFHVTPDTIRLMRAIVTSKFFGEVPEGDEEVVRWMEGNPEKAEKIERMIETFVKELRGGPRPEFENNLGERLRGPK